MYNKNSLSYLLDKIHFAISKLTEDEKKEFIEAAQYYYTGVTLPKDLWDKAAKLGLAYKTSRLRQNAYQVFKDMVDKKI